MLLNPTTITGYYPQPNNSFSPVALIAHLNCWWCWLARRPYFIWCMKETSWADTTSLYLLLPNIRQRNAGSLHGSAVVEWCVSLSWNEVHMLASEMQRFWVWTVDPLRKKWMNCLHSDGGVWPENNLGKVTCLLTKATKFHKTSNGFLLASWFHMNRASKWISIQIGPFKNHIQQWF